MHRANIGVNQTSSSGITSHTSPREHACQLNQEKNIPGVFSAAGLIVPVPASIMPPPPPPAPPPGAPRPPGAPPMPLTDEGTEEWWCCCEAEYIIYKCVCICALCWYHQTFLVWLFVFHSMPHPPGDSLVLGQSVALRRDKKCATFLILNIFFFALDDED